VRTVNVAGCTEGTYAHQAGRLYKKKNQNPNVKTQTSKAYCTEQQQSSTVLIHIISQMYFQLFS